MKHFLYFIIMMFTVLNISAQVANEVVFKVKKKDNNTTIDTSMMRWSQDRIGFAGFGIAGTPDQVDTVARPKEIPNKVQSRYYYRGYRTESFNTIPTYALVEKLDNVLSFCEQEPNADTISIPYAMLKYDRKKDTVYAQIQQGNTSEKKPVFIRNKLILNNPASVHSMLSASPVYDDKQVYYMGKGVKVNSGGNTYTCIKLIGTKPTVELKYKTNRRTEGTAEVVRSTGKSKKLKVNTVHVYYLRESDYLPVRIQWATSVKKFDPANVNQYPIIGTAWELEKVIE